MLYSSELNHRLNIVLFSLCLVIYDSRIYSVTRISDFFKNTAFGVQLLLISV